ncbi:hypothetical protein KBJ94_29210 [Pseudomonas sp. ITA]|uniref:hypothetical protein n=1 Tax=Pseudomonas sp. ITA TaxID=2825841 RepID=UPI002495AF07|nr:hypothetical protein [Pseudomonas sp. ITA]MDI2146129.1 hypothetical protein [Pseudomonas sp. ITA]
MSDSIVTHGDMVKFDQLFGDRTVIAPPTVITGSGKAKINNKPICILGDEKQVMVEGVPYTTPSNSIPGTGTLTVLALDTSQQAQKTLCGQPVIIKGQKFKAQFLPTQPAMTPPPASTPDPMAPTTGTGSFNPSQQRVKAQ